MTIPVDEANEAGWRKWKCARCGRLTGFTPHSADRIRFHGCTGLPMSHEWGHWLALILGAFFVTTESWLWIKARFGLSPKCGCEARKTWLNRLGASWFKP